MVDVDLAQLALWAAVTGGTPLVLAFVPFLRRPVSDRVTHIMLGASAGILLGVTFMDILPESFVAGEVAGLSPHVVPLGAAAGFFLLLAVEQQLLRRGRRGHAVPEIGHEVAPFGTLALSALAIHGLIDGFVIPLGFALGSGIGTIIVLAVALHQIPDSFAALSIGLAATHDRRKVAMFVVATAIDTPLGILLGVLFLGGAGTLVPLGLAFAGGTFLFVSAADLIPELQHRSRSLLVTLSIFAGFILVATATIVLPAI